mmetsp:Transcript_14369/g.41944  ORF Transcript_14369/g.41944 Transcript_14369/m.41944 type:complete len:248 (-) Transcript_14369:254-997(-)
MYLQTAPFLQKPSVTKFQQMGSVSLPSLGSVGSYFSLGGFGMGALPLSSGSSVHTLFESIARSSRQSATSGNTSRTSCQSPRTQSHCRFASASVARFSKHRNWARKRFGEQSYAVRSAGVANTPRSCDFSYQEWSSSWPWQLLYAGEAARAVEERARAGPGTSPSPESDSTAESRRVASANSASCGRSIISAVGKMFMAVHSSCSALRAWTSPCFSSSAASDSRLKAAAAPARSGCLSGCSARDSCR